MRTEDLIDVSDPSNDALVKHLAEQNISLKTNELTRIAELLGRNPSLIELHIFNVMWSEHCSYKSSRPLLRTLPTKAPHVVLGPGEDAGIISFYEKSDKKYCLVLAHESHNHPSQVLPVEGAATGIGGIVRDVYCMGADVTGVLDPLRFGDPEGPNARRVKDIVRGVVDGIAQYGNALGVPNCGGEVYFDASFDDNCLVNVVALGVVMEDEIVRSRAPKEAADTSFDVILVGKPTDASGFGGAAFASERLSEDEAAERQEAVQVPDPFLKRVLAEAIKVMLAEARDNKIPIGFKDLGAGGIACAVSEMAQAAGVGTTVDLDKVSKSSDSLPAEVVACSETQERFAVVVPKSFAKRVCEIFNEDFDMPHLYPGAGAYVIGHTTKEKQFKLIAGDACVCDADVDAITTGIEYERAATARSEQEFVAPPSESSMAIAIDEALMTLLSSYNIADKSILYRHYDSEVQGRAVLRPGEADASVALLTPGEKVGVAASIGSHSRLGLVDPYSGGAWAVCEAARNVACVGGLPLAITDCLNYGDPEDPNVFWDFSEGVRGIADACNGLRIFDNEDHGIPVVSGNVSFYNQSTNGQPIAPTPIVSCAGRVDDVSVSQSLAFKSPGNPIVLLGRFHDQLGGSEYAKLFAPDKHFEPPLPDFELETQIIKTLVAGFNERAITAAHDVSSGGVLVTLAEMVMAAPDPVGCSIDVQDTEAVQAAPVACLFAEYCGVIVEVDASKWEDFQHLLLRTEVPSQRLGATNGTSHLRAVLPTQTIELTASELKTANIDNGKIRRLLDGTP